MTRETFTVSTVAAALARVPLLPAAPLPGSDDSGEELLAEGVFLASRQASAAGDTGRRAVTMRGYGLRARWRPTPLGVFAGVAPATFHAGPAQLTAGNAHRCRSHPGAAWLAAVAAMVVADPGVLPGLTLYASNLAIHRGSVLEGGLPGTAGRPELSRITIRATEATTAIMRICETGARHGDLLGQIGRRWPHATEGAAADAVAGMVRTGFLLTDLLPADMSADPVGHLTARLPAGHRLQEPLQLLRSLLATADEHPPGTPARLKALLAARDTADEITYQERPLTVDTAADAIVRLPQSLARDAAAAAGALWRAGSGRDPLASWHDRFLDRYGLHRRVPLLEATDPATGLGPDTGSSDHYDTPSAARTAVLSSLYHKALAEGTGEIVLSDADIDALASTSEGLPPRTAEIYVRVVADSAVSRDNGHYRLAVCPASGSQDAGSTAGRFTGLLPDLPAGTDREPGALVAELLIAPRSSTAASLAVPTGLAEAVIPVGVPARGERAVPLGDLMLASDGRRLIVWSGSRGLQVIPVLYSRVAPALLPPLARFLQLAGRSGTRPWRAWSWEHLDAAPYQPRVRYCSTILAPARWTLPPLLRQAAARRTDWDRALQAWAADTSPRPPAAVVTDDADRRIPIDLNRALDRELLRRLARQGLTAVTETPGGPGAIQEVVVGPAGHHVLELTIPLTRYQARPTAPAREPGPVRPPGQGLHLPGSAWLSAAIRSPARYQDELLASLADLAARHAGDFTHWFWLRYTTPAHGPHLRVRFHGTPATLGGILLPALATWSADTIARRLSAGFTIEPYEQETERYGGPDAISAAEHVFTADSHLTLTALAATRDNDQRLLIAALSAAAIAGTLADRHPAALGTGHVDPAGRHRLAQLRPQVRTAYRQQATAWPAHPAWASRQAALLAYRDALKPQQRPGCASAMIHMHANRLPGGTALEPSARALAADLFRLPA